MASTFAGLVTSTNGLNASKAGVAVTNNNVSNLNTPGYSRQILIQKASGPAAVYSRNYAGNGPKVECIQRVRDSILDKKYWQESGRLGKWESQAGYLKELESVIGLGDQTNTGSTLMANFYSAMETLAKDSNIQGQSARNVLKNAGAALCDYLNDTAERLSKLEEDANLDVKTTVEQINSYARQIAELNGQITTALHSGASANELEDARDLLLDKLSKLTGFQVSETTGSQADGGEKKLTVSINGIPLVCGDKARQLECYLANGTYSLRWSEDKADFSTTTGALGTYLGIRDGDGASPGKETKGLPYYMNQLNKFAQVLAQAFNEGIFADGVKHYAGHAGGTGLNGKTGIRFFSYINSSTGEALDSASLMASGPTTAAVYANITAANISLSKEVLSDLDNIAAASSTGVSGNPDNIKELIKLWKDNKMFNTGTPDDFLNSIVSTLGTASSYAQTQSDHQSKLVKYITASRSSVSGVSSNEETVNTTRYQKAYEASAKMVSTWDEIFAVTINMVSD